MPFAFLQRIGIDPLLFTTPAIVLFNQALENGGVLFVAVSGGYLALKGFVREEKTGEQVLVTIHSIWGSGVSLSFAAIAGWMFWTIAGK